MALLRDHVQQHRPLKFADQGEVLLQLADIVPIDRPDIAEAQVFEKHPAQQTGLYGVFHLREESLDRIADDRHFVQVFLNLGLQAGIERIHPQAVERFGQSADARTDRHLVVVQDDDEILFQPAGIVHGLEDDARGEGAVADHGQDVPLSLGPQQFVAHAKSQGSGHATTGVAGHKEVIFAFGRIGIAHQPALRPHGGKFVVAAGQHLVGVNLMARVPDEPIVAEIERGVEGDGQFHHAQVRGEMGRPRAGQPADGLADFPGQLGRSFCESFWRSAGRGLPRAVCPSTIPFQDIACEGL